MKINKPLKAIIGFFSMLPLLYVAFYLTPIIVGEDTILNGILVTGIEFTRFMIITIFVVVIIYADMIFLIVHVVKNEKFTEKRKLFWILMIVFTNLISFPVYWYLHIFRESGEGAMIKNSLVNFLSTIFFFLPLILLIFILVLQVSYSTKGHGLSYGALLFWAAFFDLTFFPALIYLLVKNAKNKDLPKTKKVFWFILLIILNMVVFPLYYLRYIKRPG
jgi:hypothetical protein